MASPTLRLDALVLYKQRPARVTELGAKKIAIQTENGVSQVRPKDVVVLHQGPLRTLSDLTSQSGEIKAAWELLAGSTASLADVAELAFGDFTPATAWATWELMAEGLYFTGSPESLAEGVVARTPAEVEAELAARAAKAAEEAAWQAFAQRMADNTFEPDDRSYLEDVAALALGQREQSRTLRALGRNETPQEAHALLLAVGFWTEMVNPHPVRLGMADADANSPLDTLPDEPRRDLTHLAAWAIDDEGNTDPDDAISWDDGRLWVHVADVAALVPPDSAADLEARARGANLYLPEGTIHMLPPAATAQLGLGLTDISPALSIGITVADDGELGEVEIVPSLVRVTRLSYAEADERLDETPLAQLTPRFEAAMQRRLENGAVEMDLPEAKIRVVDGAVRILPLPTLRSRLLVREAMLMAGEAVARYAVANEIPLLFTVQEAPDLADPAALRPTTLSEMFALRRLLKPGRQKVDPGPHAGLGLDLYVQVTSPLRRYLDLVAHQQLRAHVRGQPLLDADALATRLSAYRAVVGSVRQAERRSNAHWTLVHLLRHPEWEGTGIIVERRGARCVAILPELAYDTEIYVQGDVPLDSEVTVRLSDVNLPQQEARFQVQ